MAMARPCTRVIKEHNLAQKLGVTAIFNLQENGEHASCGDGIEPESGFSYKPEDFMNNGIFYYNFGWKDMTAPDLGQMLNIVQVMHFSLTETSSKIAVHCHAGLGRTGLAICCYLLYSNQMGAEEALKLVRSRRPSSVQNRRQTDFLTRFEKYIVALRITFPTKSSLIPYSPSSSSFSSTTPSSIFTKLNLASIMRRQRLYNHGVEHRQLKFVPKIVFVIVTKLVKQIEEAQGKNTNLIVFDCIANFRVASNSSGTLPQHVCDCRDKINAGIWTSLTDETDVLKLIEILLYWLLSLREPIISDLHFPSKDS